MVLPKVVPGKTLKILIKLINLEDINTNKNTNMTMKFTKTMKMERLALQEKM